MTRLMTTSLLAVAAFAVAGQARAELHREAMATGEAVPAATAVQAQDAPDASNRGEPAAVASPKPATARQAQPRAGGSPAPDWRALIPGSLR